MENIKCPSCGNPNLEQIDTDKYQCPYCGKTVFISSSSMPKTKQVCIHGYTQWFAINPDVKVYVNGQLVGKVGKDEVIKINIESRTLIKFECNMRSTKIDVDPTIDSDIYISWDRISGCLLANKQECISNNFIGNEKTIDKPNIVLDILSFLIPIVGLILFFVKKSEYPNSAKSYLICAICGFALGFIFGII